MSNKNIFAQNAPQYWEAGFDIIPVKTGSKRPTIGLTQWPGYLGNTPSLATRTNWLNTFATAGIGLLLGSHIDSEHVLTAVDVDQDRFIKPVKALLEHCSAAKRGKKGCTFFCRSPIKPKLKKKSYTDFEKNGALDFLAGGSYTVIPPSIHPETNTPYVWEQETLLTADLSALPVVDQRTLNVLSRLLAFDDLTALESGATTHDATLRLTMVLVMAGAHDEEITRIVTSLLPDDYSGNTLDELAGMVKSARDKASANHEPVKSSASKRLLEYVSQQNIELFRDEINTAYLSYRLETGAIRTMPIRSGETKVWLIQQFF